MNETIRIIIRTLIPFIVLVIFSYLSTPDDRKRLDRFFVKMKTPTKTDRREDAKEMERSYANPGRFDHNKLFPGTNWEFEKLDSTDIKGIVWFTLGGILILVAIYVVSLIGR